jgi:hypothetical protein
VRGDGTGASRPGAVTPRLARTPGGGHLGLQCSEGGSSELIKHRRPAHEPETHADALNGGAEAK